MIGYVGRLAIRRRDIRGLPVALGVLWSPPASRARRKLSPRLLLPEAATKLSGAHRSAVVTAFGNCIRAGAACLALSAWS